MPGSRIAIYFVRRDQRVSDNLALYALSQYGCRIKSSFTHLLPVFVLPPDQIEVSGLLMDGETSPYPQAITGVSGIWKCGIHRVKFLAESVWDMKTRLQELDSGLLIRVGYFPDVLESIVKHYARHKDGPRVTSVWMSKGFSTDEMREEREIAAKSCLLGLDVLFFPDRKPFIDLRDSPMEDDGHLPDSFSDFLEEMEPLIDEAHDSIEAPESLPPFPQEVPLPQPYPFKIPSTLPELIFRLWAPVRLDYHYFNGLRFPELTLQPAPLGGETYAIRRLRHIVKEGIASRFHTLNDLEETDECLNMWSYLSFGCISARQIHEELWKLESGNEPMYAQTPGFGQGENPGTRAIRRELLRRDFHQRSVKRHGYKLFEIEGCGPPRNPEIVWKTSDPEVAGNDQHPCYVHVEGYIVQFQVGATGYGLIDAIMRQLLCTGHMGTEAHVIVAKFFAQFAGIDWRIGAEWVASLSTDHDTSTIWYIWQNCAGVGPDLMAGARVVSPVHAAFEIDPNGSFVRKWVPELRRLTRLSNLFQVGTTSPELLRRIGLFVNVMVTNPIPSDTLDLGPTSRVWCGLLHPDIFFPRPDGFLILGPYPRYMQRRVLDFWRHIPRVEQTITPTTPPGLFYPPPGFLWFPVPGSQEPNPLYFLAPHPALVRYLHLRLFLFFRNLAIIRYLLEIRQRRQTSGQMPPQQNTQMPTTRNGEFALPLRRDVPRAPQDAPRALRTTSVATEAPTVLQVTQVLQHPRRTQSLAEPQRRLDVDQELRGVPQATQSPQPPQSAPRAPRVDCRPPQPPQAPPNAPRAPRADQRPSQAPRNAPVAPQAELRPPQAPRNDPTSTRANARPFPAPRFAGKNPQAYVQRSQAPQSAPTATIQPSRGYQAPLNAPQAPRAYYQPYQTPQIAPSAPRASRAEYQTYQSYLPYQNPVYVPSAPQAPRTDAWQPQAPQSAPRGPRAMRVPLVTPPESPQDAHASRAPRTVEVSSLAGEMDASSRYGPQASYEVPSVPSVQVPAVYGPYTLNSPAAAQLMGGVPYYHGVQNFQQWRTSDPAINAWYIGAPDPEEVLRHGMILRFLESLPPTPPNPNYPPEPPQQLRRTRRRRATRSSDDYGSSNQEGPSEEAATTDDATQNNAESAQGWQGKKTRRCHRGRRGRGRGRGGKENSKDEESDAREEVRIENDEGIEDPQVGHSS